MPDAAAPTVLTVDGNSVFHRAWHAYERSKEVSGGESLFAVYGFFALLAGICDKTNPDALIVGFDSPENDRKLRWPAYKAQRGPKPEGFLDQMVRAIDMLESLDVAVVQHRGWEADDVCGSVAAAAEGAGWSCVIATSDRDSFALISSATTVLRLASGLDNAVRYSPSTLVDRYGVRPDQYVSYAALRGDASDNLPGVAGVGEKTAARILSVTSVEELLAAPDSMVPYLGAKVIAKVVAGRGNYERNIEMMTIRRDLPVDLQAAWLGRAPELTASDVGKVFPNLANRMAFALAGRRAQSPI